jgi:hypothetical protein
VIIQLKLTVILPAKPCREDGSALPPNAMPPEKSWNVNWSPFEDELQFCIADFLYPREEMSQGNINTLLNLWGLSLMKHGATFGPFDNYQHIFNTIDDIEQGGASGKTRFPKSS